MPCHGPHRPKVVAVKREHPVGPVLAGDGDGNRVGNIDVQIGIPLAERQRDPEQSCRGAGVAGGSRGPTVRLGSIEESEQTGGIGHSDQWRHAGSRSAPTV